jgi:hypothetical protein
LPPYLFVIVAPKSKPIIAQPLTDYRRRPILLERIRISATPARKPPHLPDKMLQ